MSCTFATAGSARSGAPRRAAVVVGRGGWLRLPEDALREAGIVDRVTVTERAGVIELRSLGPGAARRARSALGGTTGVARGAPSTRRGGTAPRPRARCGDRTIRARAPVGRHRAVRIGQVDAALADRRARRSRRGGGRGRGRFTISEPRPRRPGPASVATRLRSSASHPASTGFISARENIELGLAIRGIDGVDAHERAIDALVAVGLAAHADLLYALLSAGQRERVAVARALAARTAVILADEPTSRAGRRGCAHPRRPLRGHHPRARDDVHLCHPRPGADRTSPTTRCSCAAQGAPGRIRGRWRPRRRHSRSRGYGASGASTASRRRCAGHDGLESANANLMGEVLAAVRRREDFPDELVVVMAKAGFRELQIVSAGRPSGFRGGGPGWGPGTARSRATPRPEE